MIVSFIAFLSVNVIFSKDPRFIFHQFRLKIVDVDTRLAVNSSDQTSDCHVFITVAAACLK